MQPVACWAADQSDISCHFAIRHQVFVEEQGVMVFTDVDDWDRTPGTLHMIGASGNDMAGTVRLYALDDSGLWKGDRLAVLTSHRASHVGARLVRFAVATAAAAGGLVMHATVQLPNIRFFERLGWHRDGPAAQHYGLPHQPMAIDLPGATTEQAAIPAFPELHLPTTHAESSPLLSAS
ncbi:GNAT family N-acetyltransferase [Acidimicrobiales bacterium]|jgi:putative N-acetyltransferase (TIGR04045 family)|nr:GNAT family N-acetyltransferase [Acidimicrobiales bacterium]